MNRRHFLTTVGVGGLAASAGCLDEVRRWRGEPDSESPSLGPTGPRYAPVSLPVASTDLRRGAAKDGIPAITTPAFAADWSSVAATLSDDAVVVGVVLDGEARAYPLAVLLWHEVVNDVFASRSKRDRPVLVTYCPLCGNGFVADRTVTGKPRTFGVSGLLWHADLVLYDVESGSLWSHLLATSISGPSTGTILRHLPSTTTTWDEWRREHPTTQVLLPPPLSGTVKGWQIRDYNRNPYLGYDRSVRIGVGDAQGVDRRLHPKTVVLGVASGGVSRAYPRARIEPAGVVNDTVGRLPVVVTVTAGGSLVAYDRRVGSRVLRFTRHGAMLAAGRSRWNPVTGTAVDGPYRGTTLRRVDDRSPLYWFAWAGLHPHTEIYG